MAGRDKLHTDYLNNILSPTNTMTGDAVPVSDFLDTANGNDPSGTAAYEKRGIAADVPHWEMANCMQCNWCSYVCPHGVIRPFVLNEEEAEAVKDSVSAYERSGRQDSFAIGNLRHGLHRLRLLRAGMPCQRTKRSPCMPAEDESC